MIVRLDHLPEGGLADLVAEADRSGHRFVRRLVEDWQAGANRFDGPGEALFAAVAGDRVVGVCGLNVDPYGDNPTIGRVRHLFVDPAWRGQGVGGRFDGAVIAASIGRFVRLRLRTDGPIASRFYERHGFLRCTDESGCTHAMNLDDAAALSPRASPGSARPDGTTRRGACPGGRGG